ncbi:DUF1311 domain-containing protein [Agrobacterium rhizogenes]|uniref:lysozyme inhibitor LprI family protein n=1 Tax=Rhizobium rhizogenes TaxID=359 RepID=UPI001571FF67|nr:lysozyme inhibitor LprI family protein [Rhizobium rhizogenes]NTG51687.1 DUF1311 domain-containing protein [Rhizobium rhizogenes]
MTRFLLHTLCLAGLCAYSSPSIAIDCSNSNIPVEKLICGEKDLLAADHALNKAYAAIIEAAPDAEIRSMLVDSQRRWVVARDAGLERIIDDSSQLGEDKTPRDIALDVIHNRTAELKAHRNDGTRNLIYDALQQRRFHGQFSGGAFAGYKTSCNLLPPDNIYACFSTRHYQNGARVCSVDEYWASGSVHVDRYVADIENSKPKLIASCAFTGDDSPCPGSLADDTRRNAPPDQNPDFYASRHLSKLDAEADDKNDEAWLRICLTDASFPFADPASPGEGPKGR